MDLINNIGKVVFDKSNKEFALLLDVHNSKTGLVGLLEYSNNEKREVPAAKIEVSPIRYCFVEG